MREPILDLRVVEPATRLGLQELLESRIERRIGQDSVDQLVIELYLIHHLEEDLPTVSVRRVVLVLGSGLKPALKGLHYILYDVFLVAPAAVKAAHVGVVILILGGAT